MAIKKTRHAPLLMRGTAEGGGEAYRANCVLLVRLYGGYLMEREPRLMYTSARCSVRELREAWPVAVRVARAKDDNELLECCRVIRDFVKDYDAEKREHMRSLTPEERASMRAVTRDCEPIDYTYDAESEPLTASDLVWRWD